MTQPSLLDWQPSQGYPSKPGYRRTGTSRDAAKAITPRALSLKVRALGLLKDFALTADEIAAKLGVTVLSARPRVAELHCAGKIYDTGRTRANESGLQATVWKALP